MTSEQRDDSQASIIRDAAPSQDAPPRKGRRPSARRPEERRPDELASGRPTSPAVAETSPIEASPARSKAASPDRSKTNEVVALDPGAVRRSKWDTRHPRSYSDSSFQALMDSIASAGRNVQPIKVRPAPKGRLAAATQDEATQTEFEVVYGHRRLAACAQLGIVVFAIVEAMSDRDLFIEMDQENRAHKNLSAYEYGAMFCKAIDSGLFPSMRQLAQSVGVDVSMVSKAIAIAQLPEAVIAAFPSPLEIQYRWATKLKDACDVDRETLIARAQGLTVQARGKPLRAAKVFRMLIEDKNGPGTGYSTDKTGAVDEPPTLKFGEGGRLEIRFSKPIEPARQTRIIEALKRTLTDKALR